MPLVAPQTMKLSAAGDGAGSWSWSWSWSACLLAIIECTFHGTLAAAATAIMKCLAWSGMAWHGLATWPAADNSDVSLANGEHQGPVIVMVIVIVIRNRNVAFKYSAPPKGTTYSRALLGIPYFIYASAQGSRKSIDKAKRKQVAAPIARYWAK